MKTETFTMETADAAWVVARAHPHGLPQVRLLKLLWLAELKHYEKTGTRLTSAGWWRWQHGPYSKDVINTVKGDSIKFELEETTTDAGRNMLAIHANRIPPPRAPSEALQALEDTLWMYSDYTDEEILAEVYADPFFEATRYSHDFDFAQLPQFRERPIPEREARRLLALATREVHDLGSLFD